MTRTGSDLARLPPKRGGSMPALGRHAGGSPRGRGADAARMSCFSLREMVACVRHILLLTAVFLDEIHAILQKHAFTSPLVVIAGQEIMVYDSLLCRGRTRVKEETVPSLTWTTRVVSWNGPRQEWEVLAGSG